MNKTLKTLGLISLITSTALADIDIQLDPMIDEVVPGKRIMLKAAIDDPAGLDVVRTYFKAVDAANFSFVPMGCENNICSGIIPAVSEGTKGINYLVLVKNGENKVYKTQTIDVETLPADADTPDYQNVPGDGVVQVKTELAKAPEMVQGFTDNIALDTVEDTVRYGIVAGLGSGGSGTTAAAAAASTGTTAAGTVAATGAITTTAMVAGGLAVAGGAAAAGGGSSGSSSSHDSSNDNTKNVTTACDTTATSGGDTPELHTINLGTTAGTFDFTYEMYSIKDRMVVKYEGNTLYDTGCVSGSSTESLSFSGSADYIQVDVKPLCDGDTSGTAWDFRTTCPK